MPANISHIVLCDIDIYITEIRGDDGATRRSRELGATARLLAAIPGLADASITHADNGRPLLDGRPEKHISISHSKHHAALSVGNMPHGIDIETLRPQLAAVARRFVRPDDAVDTSSLSSLLQAWTAKEATFKAACPVLDSGTPLMLMDIAMPAPHTTRCMDRDFTVHYKALPDDTLLSLAIPN